MRCKVYKSGATRHIQPVTHHTEEQTNTAKKIPRQKKWTTCLCGRSN